MHTDKQLVNMLKSSNTREVQQAQEVIYNRNLGKVVSKAKKKGFDRTQGYDLAKDAMIALVLGFKRRTEFMPDSLDGYYIRIAYNLLAQAVDGRKKERDIHLDEDLRDDMAVEEETVQHFWEKKELQEEVMDCLTKLSEKCKRMFFFRYLPHHENLDNKLSWNEIASQLGYASEPSAKSAFTVCKEKFVTLIITKFPSLAA